MAEISTPVPDEIPKKSLTPTLAYIKYPVEFPLPKLSPQQIKEVADCKIEELALNHYPENIGVDNLLQSYNPVSNCDWAVLAYSYAVRNDNDYPSQLGIEAYNKSISLNYGFAFHSRIFYYYFGSTPMVDAPQFTNQPITKIEIIYSWGGYGNPSSIYHNLVIDQADSNPILISNTDTFDKNIKVNKEQIQGLTYGLIDLLPIDSKFQDLPCTDNFPSWLVTLKFVDGTQLVFESNSNSLFLGGPWQTQIDDQIYLQNSPVFANKMGEIMESLDLPLGEPFGMMCDGGIVFENAFTNFLPPTPTPTKDFASEVMITKIAQTVSAILTQMPSPTPTPAP
jgi:hypothetical protein